MNKTAIANLGLLDVYLPEQKLISEGCELSLIDRDDYDTVSKVKDLEYPIYYTYSEILNLISYDNDLSYKKRLNYLERLYESLDVLIRYIDDYNEKENTRLCYIVEKIYERHEIVKSQTLYTNPWSEKIVLFFDELVDGFRLAGKYLYHPPISCFPLHSKMVYHLDDSESDDDNSSCSSEQESSENEDSSSDNCSEKEQSTNENNTTIEPDEDSNDKEEKPIINELD